LDQQTGLLRKTHRFLYWRMASYDVKAWTLRKADQKYLESFEIWCCRRTEKISCTDRVNNDEVLQRFKEERNIVPTIKRRKVNLIGDMLCWNWLL
jgi:hypothetical protein